MERNEQYRLDDNLAGTICPKCDETIWRDGTCGCGMESWPEEEQEEES